NIAGIAERADLARRLRIVDRNCGPGPLKGARRRHADHAGADDGDPAAHYRGSGKLEAAGKRVAAVDEDRVDAVEPRPAGDARHDRAAIADLGRRLDASFEQGADDALMDEILADREPALRRELGHAGRGAGAAGRAVDRLVAVIDRITAMGAAVARP